MLTLFEFKFLKSIYISSLVKNIPFFAIIANHFLKFIMWDL